MLDLKELNKEELMAYIQDMAKLWLAHDGLWFQAVEKEHGMEEAIELDRRAWKVFTILEAKRIMNRLNIKPGGGLEALDQALRFRLYAHINKQKIVRDKNRLVLEMTDCRVQSARARKNLPDFPCKSVGIEEYSGFARTIDKRISTRCIACPPDKHPPEYYCSWEFILEEE